MTDRRTFDVMLDALGHVQRRKLLMGLMEHNPQDDSPFVESDPEGGSFVVQREGEMYHVHLPKLEGCGFVDWDRGNHEVAKGPNFDDIEPLLEVLEEHENEMPSDWL